MSSATNQPESKGRPVSIRARVVVGFIIGLLGGTFFALIIAAMCLVLWLVLSLTGWGGGVSGVQMLRSGLAFIVCAYLLSILGGVWASLRRH